MSIQAMLSFTIGKIENACGRAGHAWSSCVFASIDEHDTQKLGVSAPWGKAKWHAFSAFLRNLCSNGWRYIFYDDRGHQKSRIVKATEIGHPVDSKDQVDRLFARSMHAWHADLCAAC